MSYYYTTINDIIIKKHRDLITFQKLMVTINYKPLGDIRLKRKSNYRYYS